MAHQDPKQLRLAALNKARELIGSLELPAGTALAATGSFARGEMTTKSDLDIMLIHPAGQEPDRGEIEKLIHSLWDSSLRVDHSIRTPDENEKMVSKDPVAAQALLDLRYVAGNEALVDVSRRKIIDRWRRELNLNFDRLVATAISRWRRSGSVVTMTHPDIKNGRGGLRDIELLHSLALGQVYNMPDVQREREVLLDVRTLLHLHAHRARDVLDPEFAADICTPLGFPDRYELARVVAEIARHVDAEVTKALRTVGDTLSTQQRNRRRATRVRRPLDVDVVQAGDSIMLARDPDRDDPGLLLRVAAAASRTGLPITPGTWSQLKALPPLPQRLPRMVAADFFALLTSPDHAPEIITQLDHHGLWEPLVPEWAHIRGRMPRERVHVYTIDRHSVVTVSECAKATVTVSRPDLLLLAALFHDIGKGYDRPHETVGAEIVARMAVRLGLNLRDRSCVQTLVAEHTTIARIAATVDPRGDEALDQLLAAVHHDLLTVELLGALTQADAIATGPGVWTNRLRQARDILVARARKQLTELQPAAPIVYAPGEIGMKYLTDAQGEPVPIAYWRGNNKTGLVRLLAVFSAKAWTIDEARVVRRADGTYHAECEVRSTVAMQVEENDLIQAYKSGVYRELPDTQPAPTATFWRGTVLEIRTPDRAAALGTVVQVLPPCRWMRATNVGGTMIMHADVGVETGGRAEIERAVVRALGQSGPGLV